MYKKYVVFSHQKNIYKITTENHSIINALVDLYRNNVFDEEDISSGKNIIDIMITQSEEGNCCITYKNSNICTEEPLQILHNIFYDNMEYETRYLVLHGAAMGYQTTINLLLAPTTGGKSTLSAYLVNRGMNYYSDDCAIVDLEQLIVVPSDTSICMREQGWKIIHSLFPDIVDVKLVKLGKNNKRYVYKPKYEKNTGKQNIRLFFLQRNENINMEKQISDIEKFQRILKSVINPQKFTREYMKKIMKVVSFECYEIFYRDMEYVYSVIIEKEELSHGC